jgi:hypothetical protein
MVNQALSVTRSRVYRLRWSFVAALMLAVGGAIYFITRTARRSLRETVPEPNTKETPQ